MSMPSIEDDMSLREIARTLADFRHEFRNQVAQLVRTDVYRAEQTADRSRIATLEKDIERLEADRVRERDQERTEAGANRRLVVGSIITAVLSFVASLLLVTLTR